MTKYIATRLHQALEIAADDATLQAATRLPHYVLDRRLVDMLGREDVQKSITAMIEAEVARLPYPELLLEFDAEHGVRRFCILRETPGHDGFAVDLIALHQGVLTATLRPARVGLTATGLSVRDHVSELDGLAAGFAAAVALMMLNTQGIEKDVIEPKALNRTRQAAGKVAVPRHTVVRIGTVVGRDGRAVPLGSGRHMPIHLRAGHARRQHFGPGNADTRVIYIPPVLVNFRPGDDEGAVRQPRKVLTR